MLGNVSRPGTAASNNTPAPRRQRAGPAAAAAMFETHTLLSTTPPNQPPSLRQRQFSTSDLFQYYALRGYAELLHSASAVEACLTTNANAAKGLPSSGSSQAFAGLRADQTSLDEAAANVNNNSTNMNANNAMRSDSADGVGLNMTTGSTARPSSAAASPEYLWLAATQPARRPTARPSVVLDPRMLLSYHQYHIGGGGGDQDRDEVCAELQPSAPTQPLCPRLRPPCSDDLDPALVQQREELARRRALQLRRAQQAMPTLQSFYDTLYMPLGDAKAERTAGAETARSQTGSPFPAPPSPSRTGTGAAGQTALGSPTSVRAFAQSHPRPFSLAAEAEAGMAGLGPNEYTHDLHTMARYGTQRTMANAAAVLRQCQAALSKEVEEEFVAAYELAHPELVEARRLSARFATGTMTSTGTRRSQSGKGRKSAKGARARSAALPPPPAGAPPRNLHIFSVCFFLCCDAQGQVSAAEFERLLAGPPFEVHYVDAVRTFFHLVHPLTEARGPALSQLPSSPQINALMNEGQQQSGYGTDAGAMSAHGEENSISVGSTTPRGHPIATNNNNSGGSLKLHTPSSTLPSRRALGNSLSYHPHHRRSSTTTNNTSGSRGGSPQSAQVTSTASGLRTSSPQDGHLNTGATGNTNTNTNNSNVAANNPTTTLRENAFVLVRELLAALDALLNSGETRLVVRWTCFNVLAQEGNGLIRKATLQALRRQRHGECEGGQAEVTASMVKALSDGFDQLAQEEEAEYMAAMSKGKKRRGKAPKLPALLPHQKSIIPLHLMRRSHMDFVTFCRFFDELPQFAAAFAHVWLPLLLTGHIVPPPTPPPTGAPHPTSSASAAHHHSSNTVNASQSNTTAATAGQRSAGGAKPDNSTSRLIAPRGPLSRASKTSFVVASTMATGNAEADSAGAVGEIEMVAAQSLSSTSGALGAAATLRPLAATSSTNNNNTINNTTTANTTMPTVSVTEIEPNTYPLGMLGDAITRRSLLRRLVHNRVEELRRGAEQRRRRPTQMQQVMEVSVREEGALKATSEGHA